MISSTRALGISFALLLSAGKPIFAAPAPLCETQAGMKAVAIAAFDTESDPSNFTVKEITFLGEPQRNRYVFRVDLVTQSGYLAYKLTMKAVTVDVCAVYSDERIEND